MMLMLHFCTIEVVEKRRSKWSIFPFHRSLVYCYTTATSYYDAVGWPGLLTRRTRRILHIFAYGFIFISFWTWWQIVIIIINTLLQSFNKAIVANRNFSTKSRCEWENPKKLSCWQINGSSWKKRRKKTRSRFFLCSHHQYYGQWNFCWNIYEVRVPINMLSFRKDKGDG